MTQPKYPNRPITKPQIKKIHTLINQMNMPDEHYRALLLRFDVESSTQFNRKEAADFIEVLLEMKGEIINSSSDKKVTGYYTKGRVYYLPRYDKVTDAQLDYIFGLWGLISPKDNYPGLMKLIKRITSKLYIHIEDLERKKASDVIYVLEKMIDKAKEN